MSIKPKHKEVLPGGNNSCPFSFAKIVEKKWGVEYIYRRGPEYALKAMVLEPGHQVSCHMHKEKKESFLVTQGVLVVETINFSTGETTVHELLPYDVLTLGQETLHTFYCPPDQVGPTIFIEASTQDSDNDNYRVFPSK